MLIWKLNTVELLDVFVWFHFLVGSGRGVSLLPVVRNLGSYPFVCICVRSLHNVFLPVTAIGTKPKDRMTDLVT